MHVHGREERDVEQHGPQDEEREAEGGVELVWEVDAEQVVFVGVEESGVLTEEFSRDSSGVGDDEEGVSEPGENVGRGGDQAEGVHGVSDDLGDSPGEQEQGEADGGLGGREEVEDEPGDVDPEEVGLVLDETEKSLTLTRPAGMSPGHWT